MLSVRKLNAECPICNCATFQTLLSLNFSQKIHLPDSITLETCRHCEFVYVTPANQADYTHYYSNTKNDLIRGEMDVARARQSTTAQADVLQEVLTSAASLNVLDYGCGGGDLITTLAERFCNHHYVGYDVHSTDSVPSHPNLDFTSDLTGLEGTFDVLIMSHVLEHIVDLDVLHYVTTMLKEGGLLYIEVPNPSGYMDHVRREFKYYIDRLHVNRFSLNAMLHLTQKHGLHTVRYGTMSLPYKEGEYPSHYLFCQKTVGASVTKAVETYIAAERSREFSITRIEQHVPLLIYGFGDNFFRCRSPFGPLDGREILAIIDQRWEALQQSSHGADYRFMSLEEALQTYPLAPIVVTLSWGAEQVSEAIRTLQHCPAPILII